MNNQHAGLSQVLAEQHITQRRQQAAHARLGRGTRPADSPASVEGAPLGMTARDWWQQARPAVVAEQPGSRPRSVS